MPDALAILAEMLAAFRREQPLKFHWAIAVTLLFLGSVVFLIRPGLGQLFVALLLALLVGVMVHATARRS